MFTFEDRSGPRVWSGKPWASPWTVLKPRLRRYRLQALLADLVREIDYLIVGQGLAGSVLACMLRMAKRRIIVIDNSHRTSASLSAAGIINPITGKRLNRPYLVDQLLADAFLLYPALEEFLGAPFFRRREVLRLLQSPEEREQWSEHLGMPEYKKYVKQSEAGRIPNALPWFGAFEISAAAQLDVPQLLVHTRANLENADSLVNEDFDYSEIRVSEISVQFRQYTARAAIFCEGYKVSSNPFFNSIALNPAKGELLTLRAPAFKDDRIIQRGKWYFRSGGDEIKAGTTYSWERLDESPTSAAKEEILNSIRTFSDFDFEVIAHTAGVRPVVQVDNRPLIGSHPGFRRLAIFNGLGSKGALQAPFASRQLIDNLERGRTIHPEFDVCRKSLWQPRRKD